jgi:hypothetical protein
MLRARGPAPRIFSIGCKELHAIASSLAKVEGGVQVHKEAMVQRASVRAIGSQTARRYTAPQPDDTRDTGGYIEREREVMTQQRLLITGGSGYLGRALLAKATAAYTVYAIYHTQAGWIPAAQAVSLSLTDRDQVLRCITALAPHVILHTAAVNPGKGSADAMWQTNVAGSRYVAEGAATVSARLVHISSDVVHDGKHAPYADDVRPSPLNAYSHSKAAAEAVVANIVPQAAIVRSEELLLWTRNRSMFVHGVSTPASYGG